MNATNQERVERIARLLCERNLDALVCTLPLNVVMLSGYWPVVGTSIAIAVRDGTIAVIVPEDEVELAGRSWADNVYTFKEGSVEKLIEPLELIRQAIVEVFTALEIGEKIAHESAMISQPVTYPEMHLLIAAIPDLLNHGSPGCRLSSADSLLSELRAIKTEHEIAHIRIACTIAAEAYRAGAKQLRAGMTEIEAASLFRIPLSPHGLKQHDVQRADGFTFCMAGRNSFYAYRSYARSSSNSITAGDFVLVHCNSYVDGYWTDITRTYIIGEPDRQQRSMFQAVFESRQAALETVCPGATAADVDHAAREVLKSHGFGEAFRHGTGHDVGFVAIDHNAPPRLHPQSPDILHTGMVFNVEPGIYIEGIGGLRHCDMVAVTDKGYDLLTPFHSSIEELVIA